ncbi:adenylate/guanylate cyclase domain-containing protein [Shimia sp.]|uniref:adenylate/guanylate cyclase domain-containing protein n=1 Tax=Shimia sp. TaxID=1954381 RepID=UPI00329812ED
MPQSQTGTSIETETEDGQKRLVKRGGVSFARAERQGMMLAAQVRIGALLLILIWQIIDSPETGLAYLVTLLQIASFAVLGLLQYLCARYDFHVKILQYVFIILDCVLMTLLLSVPDFFDDTALPASVMLDSGRAMYFLVFLMQAAFALRPALVLWSGFCIIGARVVMLVWFLGMPGVYTNLSLPDQSLEAFLNARADPNFVFLGFWTTEVIVVLILTAGLALVVQRSRRLVERRASAERSRASLARYFSPNVVDHLSEAQDQLSEVREQNVAVLFADVMGFTRMCANEPPEAVIGLLREYHNRLGQAVFANGGTLDKYIGDGLMATFGTPQSGPSDARNALKCAIHMIDALAQWNEERAVRGQPPVRVGVGVHYGPVIVGDIGNARRLEYSVIGDSVNVASRLEHLTRDLDTSLVVSDDVIKAIGDSDAEMAPLLGRLRNAGIQAVRGRDTGVPVWVL